MANTNDLVVRIINDAATREKISNIIARSNPAIAPIEDLSILENSELQYGDLTHLLTLAVNGNVTMKEQKVVVEYLRNNQHLLIPAALGMSITGVGRCATNTVLLDRYMRATTMMYADIRSLTIPLSSLEEVRGVAAFKPAVIAGR
ncbi:hypothetical protein OIU79_003660 [Salix purpurea]|uniref:Uncharacterized protein n=1 Tax=Salix purpurea TaxID=77065 RepID=A0A9Q0UME6_SALPP|nr:hypothetical protein OIU79_003660 [Salix purpurea]